MVRLSGCAEISKCPEEAGCPCVVPFTGVGLGKYFSSCHFGVPGTTIRVISYTGYARGASSVLDIELSFVAREWLGVVALPLDVGAGVKVSGAVLGPAVVWRDWGTGVVCYAAVFIWCCLFWAGRDTAVTPVTTDRSCSFFVLVNVVVGGSHPSSYSKSMSGLVFELVTLWASIDIPTIPLVVEMSM